MARQIPSDDEVRGYFESLCNWGRWGPDDDLGTLNLITPQKRLAAMATAREGISVGCARPILVEDRASDVFTAPLHYMLRSGEAPDPNGGATDFIGLAFHGITVSHIDTFSHQFWDGKLYNGRPKELVTTEQGATVGSVEAMKDGIVTRGVLLDIAKLKGKPWLEAGEPIFPEDLEAAEQAQGVRLGEGDALLFRTGWYRRRREVGPPPDRDRPGLHVAVMPWLHERGGARIAGDASQDVQPSGYDWIAMPVHKVGLVAMGLCLMDSCQFDDLAVECERLNRWEFLYIVAPLRFRHATGSPTTPLAIL